MKPTYEKLTQLNPYLKNKNKKDVDELVNAIIECGYEWNNERNSFWHSKLQQGIKTSGLDIFDAERLKKIYNEAWGNPKWQKEQKKLLFFTKLFLWSILFFLISLLSFLFLNWNISFAGIILSISIAILSESIRKSTITKRERREGTYINTKKIKWCKTCKHHKKVKDYEDELWQLNKINDTDKIPCKIYQENKSVWTTYFNKPKGERTLYPKNCPKWTKK